MGSRLKEFYCTLLQYFVLMKFSHAIVLVVDPGFIPSELFVEFIVGKIALCQ
jgi:hypothetical protein